MRTLTATELSRMRGTQEDALPDTCTVQYPTVSNDSIGQPVKSWAARGTGIECRIAPRTIRERILGSRETPVGEWVLTVAHDQTIETGDRVLYDSRTFEVVGVEKNESWELVTRAGLMEVT